MCIQGLPKLPSLHKHIFEPPSASQNGLMTCFANPFHLQGAYIFLSFLKISASFQLARSQDVSPHAPTTSTELGIKHHGLVTLLRMSRKPWCEAPKQKRSKVNWAKRNWVQNDRLNVETVPTFQKLGSLKNKKHKNELFSEKIVQFDRNHEDFVGFSQSTCQNKLNTIEAKACREFLGGTLKSEQWILWKFFLKKTNLRCANCANIMFI